MEIKIKNKLIMLDLKQDALRKVSVLFDLSEMLNDDGDLKDLGYERVILALETIESEISKI